MYKRGLRSCFTIMLALLADITLAKGATLNFTVAEAEMTEFYFDDDLADIHYVVDESGKEHTGGWIKHGRYRPQWPTAMTRKTKPQLWVVVWVTPCSPVMHETMQLKGEGQHGGVTFAKVGDISSDSHCRYHKLVSDSKTDRLVDQVNHFPKAETKVRVSFDGWKTDTPAGTALTPIYTTWKRRGVAGGADDIDDKMYETLLYASTQGFIGKAIPTSDYEAMKLVFDDFKDLIVNYRSEWDVQQQLAGESPLKYWGEVSSSGLSAWWSGWQFTLAGLMENGDGRCQAWGYALANAFWQQGIQKNYWVSTVEIRKDNSSGPFAGRGTGLEFYVKHYNVNRVADNNVTIESLPGIPGQGGVNYFGAGTGATPYKKHWPSHVVVATNQNNLSTYTIFDPSYGTTTEVVEPSVNASTRLLMALKQYEDSAIDFYTYDVGGVNALYLNDTGGNPTDSEMILRYRANYD